MKPRLLLVEDESGVVLALTDRLEAHGYDVAVARDGDAGLLRASAEAFDLVLLDAMLPRRNGFDVLRELRARGVGTPVLMLTARGQVGDKVMGLKLGADDYVTKPFSPREVVLRAKAILRRGQAPSEGAGPASFGGGELSIDEDRRVVSVRGEAVDLTPTEWGVLVALTRTPGRVYSRYELINRVRGYEFEGYERTIDSHVKNLRRKIERDLRSPTIVETVLGAGYRLGLAADA